MIFAQGSRFGGYTLFVKDRTLTNVYNFLGIPPEQRLVADAPTSGTHIVGVEFTGGRIVKVVYDVGDDRYVDLERHLHAAMARD